MRIYFKIDWWCFFRCCFFPSRFFQNSNRFDGFPATPFEFAVAMLTSGAAPDAAAVPGAAAAVVEVPRPLDDASEVDVDGTWTLNAYASWFSVIFGANSSFS